jgi:AAA+ ATPase superfamily predicted ATPase
MARTLILGSSQSGKTTLAKKLVKELGLPGYLLVCYEELGLNKEDVESDGLKLVSWKDVPKLKDATLVVEDLMTLEPKQEKILRRALDYFSHHHNLKIIVASHHVQGIGIYSLLSSFQKIRVTLAKSNLKSLDTLLMYFKYSEADRKKYRNEFLDQKEQFGYMEFDAKTRQVTTHTDKKTAQAAEDSDDSDFDTDKSFFYEPLKAKALYKKIFNALPSNIVRAKDKSMKLVKQDTGQIYFVSLLDYVHFLMSQREPPEEILNLHKFLKQSNLFIVPKCANKNPHLK